MEIGKIKCFWLHIFFGQCFRKICYFFSKNLTVNGASVDVGYVDVVSQLEMKIKKSDILIHSIDSFTVYPREN
jgi:site-specific recombinase